jgi:cyclin A
MCSTNLDHLVQLLLRPLTSYTTDIQTRITSQMRYVLVDWLVEVAEDFRLSTETLFLCVGYVDRFLSRRHIQREELQLLGITCLLIASKYEEINPPHIERFAYVSDNACTVDDIVVAEGEVLSSLAYKLASPTAKVRARCVR